jgi:hypothetical protein
MKLKKTLSIVLSLVMTICLTACNDEGNTNSGSNNSNTSANNGGNQSTATNAENNTSIEESPTKDFEWVEVSGGIEITAYKGNSKSVIVPEIIENKKVIAIAETAFSGNVMIESVVLPESIKSVASSIFSNCDNLKSLTFLGVENFDDWLYSVNSLVELNLPKAKSVSLIVIPYSVEKVYMPSVEELVRSVGSREGYVAEWLEESKLTEIVTSESFPMFYYEIERVYGDESTIYVYLITQNEVDFEGADGMLRHTPQQITESNKGQVFLSFFGKDSLVINGKSYTR